MKVNASVAGLFLVAASAAAAQIQDIRDGLFAHWDYDTTQMDTFNNRLMLSDTAIPAESNYGYMYGGLTRTNAAPVPGLSGAVYGEFDGTGYVRIEERPFLNVSDTFTMAFWANPAAARAAAGESATGDAGSACNQFAIYPTNFMAIDFGYPGHAGVGLSVGTNGVAVFERESVWSQPPPHFPALLVKDQAISGWTHVAVVFQDKRPTLFLNGRPVHTGLASTKTVHPSGLMGGSYSGEWGINFNGGLDDVRIYGRALAETEIAGLAGLPPVVDPPVDPPAPIVTNGVSEGSTGEACFGSVGTGCNLTLLAALVLLALRPGR